MQSDRFFLKNNMEDSVWAFLDPMLEMYPEACACPACRYDIVALALNSLPPRYVVREQGEVYSRVNLMEIQYRTDICAAITRAILMVKEKPRHGEA